MGSSVLKKDGDTPRAWTQNQTQDGGLTAAVDATPQNSSLATIPAVGTGIAYGRRQGTFRSGIISAFGGTSPGQPLQGAGGAMAVDRAVWAEGATGVDWQAATYQGSPEGGRVRSPAGYGEHALPHSSAAMPAFGQNYGLPSLPGRNPRGQDMVLGGPQTENAFFFPGLIEIIIIKNVVEPVIEGSSFKKWIGKPIKKAVEEVGEIVSEIPENKVKSVKGILEGRGDAVLELYGVRDFQDVAGVYVDFEAIRWYNTFDIVDNVLNMGQERALTPNEIAQMRLVFGDSIDYGKVRIQRGGFQNDVLKLDGATVVQNEIRFADKYFDGNGNFTIPAGINILTHEMTHIWQYQNRGIGYLSDSLGGQANDLLLHGGDDDSYQWQDDVLLGLKEFNDLGVEQQAELVEAIGRAMRAGRYNQNQFLPDTPATAATAAIPATATTPAVPAMPARPAMANPLTPAQWAIIQRALAIVRAGR